MSAKQKAVEDIKKLGRMFKGMIDAVEELESIGSLDQALAEAMNRVSGYAEIEAKAKTAMKEALHLLDATKAKAQEVEDTAKSVAQSVLKEGHAQADAVLSAARSDALSTIKVAELKKNAFDDEVAQAKVELEKIKQDIVTEQSALNNLRTQLAELRSRLGV